MIPLGILAAAGGAVAAAGSYDLLATEILTSSQSSITFSSLAGYAADYDHLQVRGVMNKSNSGDIGGAGIKLNGSNLTKSHYLRGYNGSVGSYAHNDGYFNVAGTGDTYTGIVLDILDAFSSDKNSTIRLLAGVAGNSEPFIFLGSSFWNDTSSITSLELNIASVSTTAGSRLSLYGIRKAAS